MKRHLYLALLCLLLISPMPLAAADTPKPNKFFSTKELIDLQDTPTWKYMDGAVAPIGWSADGKFAYVEYIINEAADWGEIGILHWVVQDMVTDKILWESEPGFEGLPDSLAEASLPEIYRWELANIKAYKAALDKYKIVLQPTLAIEKFPLVYKGSAYQAFIADLVRGKDEFEFEDVVMKYRVLVARDDQAKPVGEFKDNAVTLDVHIGGFVRSPYEPRIAVAVIRIRRGWEGPPHPVKCFFTGCHLEKGFDTGIPAWAWPGGEE